MSKFHRKMKTSLLTAIFCIIFCTLLAFADINIHVPRGSNNRLSETTRNRQNANRLFDSQNNDRGGHNVGQAPNSMFYYSGSKLRIEWAVQHSCGDENANCEIIMQYMCGEHVRDGTMRQTISNKNKDCLNNNCDTDPKYGRHESQQYFNECGHRERNMGLFTADQKVRMSARSTRQNRAGTKRGYECPEERDYYPYWWPTPWKDIVIFTNEKKRCGMYKAESQNVKGKYYCYLPEEYWQNYRPEWRLKPSHGIEEPDCFEAPWSRDNHQGNTKGGEFMHYDWTVPEINADHCVIRMRYNVSTNDYDSWDIDSRSNGSPGPQNIWQRFDMDQVSAEKRNYVLKGNPNLDIFNTNTKSHPKTFRLRIALNTAKYGRTFQDRTHTFKIRVRPDELFAKNIVNVNVRGKRGNIVQVYPSVPYDFVPNRLLLSSDDHVHFQWTGSDLNNNNNFGNGKRGSDRSNIVQLAETTFTANVNSNRSLATNYPAQAPDFLGLDWKSINKLAHLSPCEGEDPMLNMKPAYFNMEPFPASKVGDYYYMSTRNNYFGSATQKAEIRVGHRCYGTDRGESYRGFVSVSRSGKTCQPWGTNVNFEKFYNPKRFPTSGLESNFCRNPDRNSRSKPWCYVEGVVWEYCEVPSCRVLRRRGNFKVLRDEPEIPDELIEEMESVSRYYRQNMEEEEGGSL